MDLESVLSRLPIVYTTKLDEMKIFKKDVSKIRPKDIIKSIISESKPLRKDIGTIDNTEMCKKKYDIHENNSCIIVINSKFEKLRTTLKNIKMNSNNFDTNSALVVNSGIETDTYSQSKPERLRAMCKPLKIVLEDINKIVPKPRVNIEVLNISSDSEDDVIVIGEEKLINKPDANENSVTSTGISIISPVTNHIIENVSDLQKVLLAKELRNCCVVIYNIHVKELEAYQIGESYNVTAYKTRKYTRVDKFPMKKCAFVINIIACCWKKRQSFVSLLLQSKKYCDIAKLISRSHPCKQDCTCCSSCVEQVLAETQAGNEAGESDTNITDSLMDNSPAPITVKSKLITTALAFETKQRWKWYPDETYGVSNKVKSNKFGKRLLKFNNTQGGVQLYELGRDDVIYSKVVSSTDDESSWLFKTMNLSRYLTNLTFTNPVERERKVITYKRIHNSLPLNTKCFLRNPLKIEHIKKVTSSADNTQAKRYIIEHIKSLISSKRSQTLSIIPEIRKMILHTQPVIIPSVKSFPVHSLCKPQTPIPPRPIQPVAIDQEVAENINTLIKGILHRFRDVFLTINSEGRVSAALNAPLTSLTPSEVKILSEILNHAQSQVDKLGLSPGTCLAPLGIPSASENFTSTTNATNSEPNKKQTKDACTTNNKQKCTTKKKNQASMTNNKPTRTKNNKQTCTTNNKQRTKKRTHEHSDDSKNEENPNQSNGNNLLNTSSSLIASKKYSYKQSFRNYLGDKLEAAPKISDLFSSPSFNCTSSDILRNALKGRNVMIKDDKGSISNNICANELDIPITLDKHTQTIRPNKRKSSMVYDGKLPKIRVKTAAEILLDNTSPVTFTPSSHLMKFDPLASPSYIADHNYVFKNNT